MYEYSTINIFNLNLWYCMYSICPVQCTVCLMEHAVIFYVVPSLLVDCLVMDRTEIKPLVVQSGTTIPQDILRTSL